MRSKYDVSNVTRAFLQRKFEEQPTLVAEFRESVIHSLELKELAAMIAIEALKIKSKPVEILQLGMIQGMALGVLLERDRIARAQQRILTDVQ